MIEHPVATYRVQLNKDFTLQDAASIADYLRDLNISHIYLSPVFESAPGSTHGYDGTDFTRISDERGGEAGFNALADKICAYDYPMKMILDIVPNHLSTDMANPYWTDVLRKGAKSQYWHMFDIRVDEGEKIRLPILTGPLDDAISDLKLADDKTSLDYNGSILPIHADTLNLSGDLKDILKEQHYVLVPWTDIKESISYRRFFDVTSLIGVKVENRQIFDQTHARIFDMLKKYPCIDGIRIDHIDGLAEPKHYLDRLSDNSSSVWIEKILSGKEEIARGWQTLGTTGYEFIDHLNHLFIRRENLEKIVDYWKRTTGAKWQNFADCVWQSKQQVLNDLFQPELTRLVDLLTDDDKERARIFWTGLILALDVYRTYDQSDNHIIEKASKLAAEKMGPVYSDAAALFLPVVLDPKSDNHLQAVTEWRQLSGPAMAKGLEDTAHYRFTPLVAMNEVGCTPEPKNSDVSGFFNWVKKRAERFPQALNATSTHDTKRSEDARHRLYALSENPDEWILFFDRFSELTKDSQLPEQIKHFMAQNLLASWPIDGKTDDTYIDRIKQYAQKANREARTNTNWMKPDEAFEKKVSEFIDDIFSSQSVKTHINNFVKHLALAGTVTSLSVQTLKILLPGIPDIYQGTEDFDFSLVDPDNRRPIDYTAHQEKLLTADDLDVSKGREDLITYLKDNWQDGTIKIWLTRRLLHIRDRHLKDIMEGNIKLLTTLGTFSENLIAYRIGSDPKGIIVLCPRNFGSTANASIDLDWQDTGLEIGIEPSQIHDLLADRPVTASDFSTINTLLHLPVGVFSYTT